MSFRKLLGQYTNKVTSKSIDEFFLELEGYPACQKGMTNIGCEIKTRIRCEIGDWFKVSIGIAPNRFLAKTAANLNKPAGLDVIDKNSFYHIYSRLKLTDLTGIKTANTIRLNHAGIFSVHDFYSASVQELKSTFRSVLGYYWHVRLHVWEIDDVEFGRRSYGNSFALPKKSSTFEELAPLL